MKKEKIKVYTYTRVSTAMQVDGYSLDAQKAKMKAYADYNDYEIVGEYEDVCFDEESADGKLGELHGMQVTEVGLYSETHSAADITIKEMFFEDQGNTISFAGILFSEKARESNG